MSGAWTPQDAIGFAWDRIKADPGTIVGALFVGWLCSSALSIIGGIVAQSYAAASILATMPLKHGHRYAATPDPFAIWADPIYLSIRGGSGLISYIVQAFMMAGMMNFALKVARGQQYSFGDIFSGGKWFLPLLAANFCVGLAVWFGFLLLIVPGIFLGLAWSLTMPFVVDKDLGPFEAMGQSWKATEGQKGQIFVLGLFIFGIVLLGMCACGIGVVVSASIAQLAWAWTYLRITGQQTVA